MNPGTYYNVLLQQLAVGDPNAAGAGALAMVVVGGDGHIKEVQITSGGLSKYVVGKNTYIADTRLKSNMAIGAAATRCIITLGDMTSPLTSSMLLKSVASGIDSSMACLALTTGHTCAVETDGTNDKCDQADDAVDKASCERTAPHENTPGGGDDCKFTGAGLPGTYHHATNTNGDVDGMVTGIRQSLTLNANGEVTNVVITGGGASDIDVADATKLALVNNAATAAILAACWLSE
jgi:hypothetical protein